MQNRLMKGILLTSMAIAPLSTAALADTGDVAIGVKCSTLGLGAEVNVGLTPNLNIRSGYNAFTHKGQSTRSNITYDYDLKLRSIPILLDWHPLGDDSGFRLSTGVLVNKNNIQGIGHVLTGAGYSISDGWYSTENIGTLTGSVDFNTLAPYLGFGWGNPFHAKSGFSVSFDVGVAFQGDPNISLVANGPIASDQSFQVDLEQEKQSIRDEAGELRFYPVISFGLIYTL